jgi:hypothetical protein
MYNDSDYGLLYKDGTVLIDLIYNDCDVDGRTITIDDAKIAVKKHKRKLKLDKF